ncbi:MAG TPA: DUF2470 domain-containing protein [Sporichthya sp.]|nr:DUF2470 domain-containing protein [Sporichthya sp.]
MTQTKQCSVGPSEPSSAERACTLLAAADSLTVTTDEAREELVGLHSLDAVGRVLLWAPADSSVVTRILAAAGGDVEACIEITDVAAVAARDRVRARLTAHGWLSLNHHDECYGTPELVLEITRVDLAERGTVVTVESVDLAMAERDPLAIQEADLLMHLDRAHPEAVELLTRLVEPSALMAATRVLPLALDRYGIVLRIERASGHRDVRLPFPGRAVDALGARRGLGALLAAAARRPLRCRAHVANGLHPDGACTD